MPKHKTLCVKMGSREFQIDAQIALLIEGLWRLGLWTLNSCEDNPEGFIWIEFESASGAEEFLNLVTYSEDRKTDEFYDDGPDLLYSRVSYPFFDKECLSDVKQWQYAIQLNDRSVHYSGQNAIPDGPPDFNFNFSVRFPQKDLEYVIKKVAEGFKAYL